MTDLALLSKVIESEKERRACEKSLNQFVRSAWPVVEPGVPYIHGWHIDEICEHLQAISNGQIQNLLINIPPRHAKSTIVNVMWPCWEWIFRPFEKYLTASYSGILSTRDNIKARRLLLSAWYQGHWGDVFKFSGDQNQKTRFENNQTGYRIASSVGGTATGEGGSRLILDDPHGAQDAQSDAMRESALEWFDTVWSTRLNNPKKDAKVTVMQRLHEKDISGRIIELGNCEHICLPAEYDGIKRKTKLGSYDKRKEVGELLWEERFNRTEVDRLKVQLGSYGASGQLQQSPSPSGGGVIKTAWFKMWPKSKPLPALEYVVQSYDTAFTEKTTNDPTACTVWGVFSIANVYNALLIDAWAEHMEYPQLRKRVLDDWSSKYAGDETDPMNNARRPDLVIIEEKGSGQSLIQDLRKAQIPVYPYNPGKADKITRAHIISPILEAGLVWVPESKKGNEFVSWSGGFMKEVSRFPKDDHDDYVDTMTQVLRFCHDRGFIGLATTTRVDETDDKAKKEKSKGNPYAV